MKDMTEPESPPAETVAGYLREGAAAIDAVFGAGHAAANPALLAQFVQACAIQSAVEAGRSATDRSLSTVARLAGETNDTILKLKPRLFG